MKQAQDTSVDLHVLLYSLKMFDGKNCTGMSSSCNARRSNICKVNFRPSITRMDLFIANLPMSRLSPTMKEV